MWKQMIEWKCNNAMTLMKSRKHSSKKWHATTIAEKKHNSKSMICAAKKKNECTTVFWISQDPTWMNHSRLMFE